MLLGECFLDLLLFHLFVCRRLNVRVNIELLSVSNPVHKKVCGLVISVMFLRYYLNLIVLRGQIDKGKANYYFTIFVAILI